MEENRWGENDIVEMNPVEKKRRWWIWLLVAMLAIATVAAIVIWPRVYQTTDGMQIELGEVLTSDINDYVRGDEKLIAEASLNLSRVDQSKAGEYEVTVTYDTFLFNKEKVYTYAISIIDTIAPDVTAVQTPVYIGQGQTHSPEEFIEKCYDASNDVTFYLVGNNNDTVIYNDLGTKEFQIGAVDPSGNETIVDVAVIVDDVPAFINAKAEKWVTAGDSIEMFFDVLAYDEEEGFLTFGKGISLMGDVNDIDQLMIDMMTVGDYTLHFVAKDQHGIQNETDILVHVVKQTTEYPENYEVGLSQEDMTFLISKDYFTYQPLEEADYDKMIELVEPCLFDLWKGLTQEQIAQGYTGQYYGSGFILDITPEYVYMVTDEHCVKDMSKNANVKFYDTTEILDITYESITTYKMKGYGADASLFAMSSSVIPSYAMLKLKQATVTQEAYDKLKNGDEVVAYAKFWRHDKDRINKLTVKNTNGYYEKWPGKLLLTSAGVKAGMSGTGVFDLYGNLVGVVYATYTDNGVTENWHAPADAVLYLRAHEGDLDGKKVAGLK